MVLIVNFVGNYFCMFYDVVIIGGGIVGVVIFYKFQLCYLDFFIVLIEEEFKLVDY